MTAKEKKITLEDIPRHCRLFDAGENPLNFNWWEYRSEDLEQLSHRELVMLFIQDQNNRHNLHNKANEMLLKNVKEIERLSNNIMFANSGMERAQSKSDTLKEVIQLMSREMLDAEADTNGSSDED